MFYGKSIVNNLLSLKTLRSNRCCRFRGVIKNYSNNYYKMILQLIMVFFSNFLAIYLVFILALSSISVLCTILVLNFNFGTDDDPIPNGTRIFLVSLVAKLICWKRKTCCQRARKVADSSVEMVEEFDSKEETKQENITWQDLSNILDRAFFLLFTIVISFSTCIFIAVVFTQRATEE